jgi:hypothetical protein
LVVFEAVEASHVPLRLSHRPSAAGSSIELSCPDRNGVFSSLGLFETPEQGKESSNVVASWIRDEKLETLIPNPPKITSGEVIAHSAGVKVA